MSNDTASPGSLPKVPAAIFGALVVVGAVTLVFGAASADTELANRTYRVFLHNWLMWAVLSNGALVLSAGMRLTNGNWQGPIQRVADSMGAYVPASLLLFAVVYLGRHHLFAWTEHPIHGKEFWFEPTFAFARDVIALLWITFISVFYQYLSIRPMLGRARETATGLRGAIYKRWTAGWRGEERERELATRRARKLAAVLASVVRDLLLADRHRHDHVARGRVGEHDVPCLLRVGRIPVRDLDDHADLSGDAELEGARAARSPSAACTIWARWCSRSRSSGCTCSGRSTS